MPEKLLIQGLFLPTAHNLTIVSSTGPIRIKTNTGGEFYSALPLNNAIASLTFTLNKLNYISIETEHDQSTPFRLEILELNSPSKVWNNVCLSPLLTLKTFQYSVGGMYHSSNNNQMKAYQYNFNDAIDIGKLTLFTILDLNGSNTLWYSYNCEMFNNTFQKVVCLSNLIYNHNRISARLDQIKNYSINFPSNHIKQEHFPNIAVVSTVPLTLNMFLKKYENGCTDETVTELEISSTCSHKQTTFVNCTKVCVKITTPTDSSLLFCSRFDTIRRLSTIYDPCLATPAETNINISNSISTFFDPSTSFQILVFKNVTIPGKHILEIFGFSTTFWLKPSPSAFALSISKRNIYFQKNVLSGFTTNLVNLSGNFTSTNNLTFKFRLLRSESQFSEIPFVEVSSILADTNIATCYELKTTFLQEGAYEMRISDDTTELQSGIFIVETGVTCSNIANSFVDLASLSCTNSCTKLVLETIYCSNSCFGNCIDLNLNCPNAWKFRDGLNCITDCSLSTINQFYSLNSEECVASCPPGFYLTESKECKTTCDHLELDDGTGQLKCVADCRTNYFEYFDKPYRNDSSCASNCVSEGKKFYDYDCVSSCPLKHESQHEFCIHDCKELNTALEAFSEVGSECIPTCLSPYFTVLDQGIIYCLEECDRKSAFPYDTPEKFCVSDCHQAGYLFTHFENKCTTTCDSLIYSGDSGLICANTCPETLPFVEDNHCKTECSQNKLILLPNLCVNSCSDFLYDHICVQRCDSLELTTFLVKHSMVYINRPFIDGQRRCVSSCYNSGLPFINELTNQCIGTCPYLCDGSNCTHENLLFVEEPNFCVAKCSSNYPFIVGNSSATCVSKCPSNLPFFFEKDKICISKCPSNWRSNEETNECIEKCPESYLEQQRAETALCVKSCDAFHSAIEGVCVLECDEKLGFVKSEGSCVHCKRKFGRVLSNGVCAIACPVAQEADDNGVCYDCSTLNLWNYFNIFCYHDDSKCNHEHFADYSSKKCLKCEASSNLMLVHASGEDVCAETDCSFGTIIKLKNITHCYLCGPEQFYENGSCTRYCSEETDYDFIGFTCVKQCYGFCTSSCCKDDCVDKKCKCAEGNFGHRCDLSKNLELTAKIERKIDQCISANYFRKNIVRTCYEYADIIENQSSYSDSQLVSKLSDYASKNYDSDQFSITKLDVLDAALYVNFKAQSENLHNLIGFIIAKTNEIVESFAKSYSNSSPNSKIYEGRAFNFSLGVFTGQIESIDLNECYNKLTLSYRNKRIFSRTIKSHLVDFSEQEHDHLKFDDLIITFVIEGKQVADLNTICSEHNANITKEPDLDGKKQQLALGLSSKGVNLFDSNDLFFNDKCLPYDQNGKDITLATRRSDVYMNPKEKCNESEWNECSIEFHGDQIKCNCKTIGKRRKQESTQNFEVIPESNYILFFCFKTLRSADLLTNPGFFVLTFTFWLLLAYSFYQNYRVNVDLTGQEAISYLKNDVEQFDPDSMDAAIYFDEITRVNALIRERQNLNAIRRNVHLLVDMSQLLPLNQDLNNLSLENSLLYDNRSSLDYFWHLLQQEHIIFNTFFYKSLASPVLVRVWFFMLEINLSLFFSAFFVTDNLIEESNLLSSIWEVNLTRKQVIQAAFTIFCTKAVKGLLELIVTFEESKMKRLLKDVGIIRNNYPVKGFDHFMRQTRWKFFALLVVLVVLNLSFMYFLVIYNEIYKNSKAVWIKGVTFNWMIDWCVIEFTFPLIVTLTRLAAIRNRIVSWMFSVSKKLLWMKSFF